MGQYVDEQLLFHRSNIDMEHKMVEQNAMSDRT